MRPLQTCIHISLSESFYLPTPLCPKGSSPAWQQQARRGSHSRFAAYRSAAHFWKERQSVEAAGSRREGNPIMVGDAGRVFEWERARPTWTPAGSLGVLYTSNVVHVFQHAPSERRHNGEWTVVVRAVSEGERGRTSLTQCARLPRHRLRRRSARLPDRSRRCMRT